jgi:hypothetical protein
MPGLFHVREVVRPLRPTHVHTETFKRSHGCLPFGVITVEAIMTGAQEATLVQAPHPDDELADTEQPQDDQIVIARNGWCYWTGAKPIESVSIPFDLEGQAQIGELFVRGGMWVIANERLSDWAADGYIVALSLDAAFSLMVRDWHYRTSIGSAWSPLALGWTYLSGRDGVDDL